MLDVLVLFYPLLSLSGFLPCDSSLGPTHGPYNNNNNEIIIATNIL